MECDAELSAWHAQGACSWKCLQRRLSPDDHLFEAGDVACRVRFHKYVCDAQSYSSAVDIRTSAEYVAALLSPLVL